MIAMKQLWGWFVGLAALSALGCGVDSGETSTGGSGTGGSGGSGGGLVCPDDPKEGAVDPACGVWVSTSLGNDDNDGSQDAPVTTLTKAIELAEAGPGRVYACGGETWTETVVVPGSVSLHGGFDCAAGWAYPEEPAPAMLVPNAPTAMLYVNPGKDTFPFLTDFYIESADATEPGGSSIALFIRDDVGLTLTRVEMVAGNGADGLDGELSDSMPAPAGAAGNDGADACSAEVSPGGAAPETACDAETTKGGAGGDGGLMTAGNGAAGEPAGPGGAGGLGQVGAAGCSGGQPGAAGEAGKPGRGGQSKQVELTPEGYLGRKGEEGEPGKPGQGGGGGGATLGSVAVCGAATPGGAAGGSGGAGGCGGKAGKGGQAGGASLSLASRSRLRVILGLGLVFQSKNGGAGGDGVPGQPGGEGGPGGLGGQGAGSIGPACGGGPGGAGAKGGWGGGGAGGFSANIFGAYGAEFELPLDSVHDVGDGGYPGFGDPDFPEGFGESGDENQYYVSQN